MPAPASCLSRLGPRRLVLGVAACAVLAGCASLEAPTQRLVGLVKPYQVQVVQGNFVSREQVALLKAGQSRQQVRETLGTPLLTSVFHADRWDYIFTLRRQGAAPQAYRLTVFFKGDTLERFEGDTMPTEAEFVASLDVSGKGKTVPVLEATEAQLKRFPAPAASAPALAVVPPTTTYPPLEAPAR